LAVSGGPFLGLLGTVVGVMITFAAIAAEGNVDVNAIAPGVAAALLATAAGLAAAIPALFGYNMIVTRVKRINAASRAFSDALVARIAHQYGGGGGHGGDPKQTSRLRRKQTTAASRPRLPAHTTFFSHWAGAPRARLARAAT